MEKRMNRSILSMPVSGIRRVAEIARSIPGCISLTLGEPGFDTPAPVREAAKRALDEGYTHYPPNVGYLPLRETIARFESIDDDTPLTPDNVVLTAGSTEAIASALLSILQPADEVIVPTPAFGLYAQQLHLMQGIYVPLYTAEHGFQIDGDALQECITPHTKAILINTPNNPTGVQYTQDSIDAVTEACLDHDLFLIHDAVYDRLCYDEPLARPSADILGERLIRCSAFSKTYAMTGWRVGYCIAADPVIHQIAKVHASLTVGVSAFSQMACVDIDRLPTDEMVTAYRANRDLTVARLAEMGLEVARPSGAFYAFPSIAKFGLEDEEFVDRMMYEAGVAVVPGSCFGAPGYVRLSYCCDREALIEGLNRMEGFIKGL